MKIVYAYVNGKVFTKGYFSRRSTFSTCSNCCALSDGCRDRSEKRKEFGNKCCQDLIGSYFTCFVPIKCEDVNIEGGI